MGDRLVFTLTDLDLNIFNALVRTRAGFVADREKQKEAPKVSGASGRKRFDKTPW